MSDIVLNSLTYVGNGITNAVSYWYERSKGIVAAFSTLTCRVSYNPSKTVVQWKATIPVVIEPAEGCCTVAPMSNTIIDVTLRFDRELPSAERVDALTRLQELVLKPEFTGSVTNLVQPT